MIEVVKMCRCSLFSEPKPVKCHVCGRGFKNIPALNGHMRLHGGYIRKVLHCIVSGSRTFSPRTFTPGLFPPEKNVNNFS